MEAGREKSLFTCPPPLGAGFPQTGSILYRNVNTEFILKDNKKSKKEKKIQKTMYIGLEVNEVAVRFFLLFLLFFPLFGWFSFFFFPVLAFCRRDRRWYSILIKK